MQLILKFLKKPVAATVIAVLSGLIVAAVILELAGYDPVRVFGALLGGMFGRPKYMANVVVKGTPLILTGVSVAFAYKMGLFNIGAEGQYIAGAMGTVIAGILFDFPAFLQIPLVLLSGAMAGALYGAVSGCLKAKYGINEVITGIMLNWIALYGSNFLCDRNGIHKSNTDGTYAIGSTGFLTFFTDWKKTQDAAVFMKKYPFWGDVLRTDMNAGIFIAIGLAVFISILLFRTTKGYEFRAVGGNPYAAEFAGINVEKNVVQTMILAGALAGTAAAITISGTNPHVVTKLSAFEANGLNGLPVAFLAGGSPMGCIITGLLFGGLLYGGQAIQFYTGAPWEIINILIGIIVFFISLKELVPSLTDTWMKGDGRK